MKIYSFLCIFFVYTYTSAQQAEPFRAHLPGVSVATGPATITINIPPEVALFFGNIHRFTSSPLRIGLAMGATTFAAASLWKTYKVIDNFTQNKKDDAKNNSKALFTYLALCSVCVAGCRYY